MMSTRNKLDMRPERFDPFGIVTFLVCVTLFILVASFPRETLVYLDSISN